MDRCTLANGLSVISPTLTNPPKYYYSGEPLVFAPDSPFTTSDVYCPIITYQCSTLKGGVVHKVDCSHSDGDTQLSFVDSPSLAVTFTSLDQNNLDYPFGSYVVRI